MPPRTTLNSLRERYQVDPIQQEPNDPNGPINDYTGPINDQAGIAPNAPSTTQPEENAQSAPEEMMQSIGEIIHANIADSEGIANVAPSNTEHTLHNIRARNGPLHRPIQPQLPREGSTGIGRFRIDAARVINNLNLDTSVPHDRALQVPLQIPLQVNHTDQQQSNVRPV
jgi:hypothetical protein